MRPFPATAVALPGRRRFRASATGPLTPGSAS